MFSRYWETQGPPMIPQPYTRTAPALLPFYSRLIYQALLDDGYSSNEILRGIGLCAEQLNDEKFRLSIEQHEKFILRALDLTGDPHFVVRLFRRRNATSANFALLAIANGGQVANALNLITRYSKIFTRTLSVRSFDLGEQVGMELEPHLEHGLVIHVALSNFILFLDLFFRQVLDGARLLTRVEMNVPDTAKLDEFEEALGLPISLACDKTRVYFDRAVLNRTMKQADPQTVRLLMELVERQLLEANAETSFVGTVSALVAERIVSPPTLDEAAKVLGVSPRSLRRKLEKSGTTYQKLVDLTRTRTATQLLKQSNAPIAAVARELGFDNPSDFGRAFKRWTGHSPSSVR